MKIVISCKYCLFSLFFASSLLCQGQDLKNENRNSLPEEKLIQSKALTEKIIIDINKHEEPLLTGEYCDGYGLSTRRLLISPSEGYVYSLQGDMGLYRLSFGKIVFDNNHVKLLPDFEYSSVEKYFAKNYTLVRWAGRRYLVEDNRILEFCNDFNGYKEVYCFLLRKGDSQKDVGETLPEVPKDRKKYLLKTPIQAEIIKIGEFEIKRDGQANQYLTTKVVINKGQANGLLAGMKLYVFLPPDQGIISKELELMKVSEVESEGLLVQEFEGKKTSLPKIGWKLSTSAKVLAGP